MFTLGKVLAASDCMCRPTCACAFCRHYVSCYMKFLKNERSPVYCTRCLTDHTGHVQGSRVCRWRRFCVASACKRLEINLESHPKQISTPLFIEKHHLADLQQCLERLNLSEQETAVVLEHCRKTTYKYSGTQLAADLPPRSCGYLEGLDWLCDKAALVPH